MHDGGEGEKKETERERGKEHCWRCSITNGTNLKNRQISHQQFWMQILSSGELKHHDIMGDRRIANVGYMEGNE